MSLALIAGLISLDLILGILDASLQLFLLIVKLVLQGQEMLIQRNAIAQKRFIAASLILLIDLLVLEHLDLILHSGDLPVQVQDDILMNGVSLLILLLPGGQLLDLVGSLSQVRVALILLVDDGAAGARIHIEVVSGELDIACAAFSASA